MTTLLRMPIVESPHLFLREVIQRDSDAFAYMARPDYQRWIAARLSDAREIRAFVRGAMLRQNSPQRRSFHLAAVGKHDGRVIGDGFILLARDGSAEVGWGVAPERWGRGLGGEIARVLVALAIERLGAKSAWCKVMAPNRASLRVAAKAGLLAQRTITAYEAGRGQAVDVHILALDRDAYYEASY
jgi:ribosomal-protein-alanine N-acetyltransferase